MKTFVPFKKTVFANAIFAVCFASFSFNVTGQTIPELVFHNPVLTNGVAGQDGAQYTFYNVANNIDAVLEILGRSGSDVVISSIDSTSIGWDKALQPIVGIPAGVGANQNWWAKFRLHFYDAGTNHKKKIKQFFATGLDIDGDNGNLQEWVEMDKITSVSFSQFNELSDNLIGSLQDLTNLNNNGQDFKIIGPTKNFTNIDTSATSVMATYQYDQKDQIDFYLGGQTTSAGGAGSGSSMRMNSIWFKQFNLNPPLTLPIKLIDFAAKYTKPNVSLTWATAQEHNFSHFIIEHSTDGTNFSQTAVVFGAGESDNKIEYSYTDKNMKGRGGIIYYRLKQVDTDESFTYSSIRMVNLNEDNTSITLSTYPNPVVNDLRVTLPSSWQNKQVNIDLYNVSGQHVNALKLANSSQTESISVTGLQKGVYFVKANCGGEIASQQIIKN